ncbi:MAG: tetratricopeptide repeat protein [Panacagrimonas sp.]
MGSRHWQHSEDRRPRKEHCLYHRASRYRRSLWPRLFVLCAAALLWAARADAVETNAASPFEAGVAAYRAGEYRVARERFLQAEAAGLDGEELRFNLALSHYKLGDYASARSAFETLRSSPGFAAVAEYHLGLVAAQSGQAEQAAAHLRATQAMTDSAELRQLADMALQRLAATPGSRRWSASATAGSGFDSNRTQSSETVRLAQVDADAEFVELSAAARYLADGFLGAELRGNGYLRNYLPDHELDQHSAQLSLRKSWLVSAWQFGAAVETEAVWLGSERFQNAVGLNLDAGWSAGVSNLSLRYRPSFIEGGDDYEYADGQSQRAELAYSLALPGYRVRLNCETELNDRRDLEREDEFFSQSPTRHGIGARLSHRLTPALSLDWSARYRHSRYRDASRFRSGFEIVEQRRVDDMAQFGVLGLLKLGKGWGLRLDYRYTDNQSRLERYDYERHAVLLGLDWAR